MNRNEDAAIVQNYQNEDAVVVKNFHTGGTLVKTTIMKVLLSCITTLMKMYCEDLL